MVSISLIIRKLRNGKKQKDVTVDDVPRGRFDSIREIEYNDDKHRKHRYRLYEYLPGTTLVDSKYVKDATKFKGRVEESPVEIYSKEGDQTVVDLDRLVHQLVQEFGEGRINVFSIGGTPPYESIFQRRFVEVIS